MAAPIVNVSGWPLVYITFAPQADLADVEVYLRALEPIYRRGIGRPFITVADLTHVSPQGMSIAIRQRLAAGLSSLEQTHPGAKAGEAMVINSPTTRAAYSAVNLMRPIAAYERRVFATRDEARDWARTVAMSRKLM